MTNYSGYGFLTPEDSISDFTAVAFLVRRLIEELETMKLVQVAAVHGGGGTIAAAGAVDVQPLVNYVDGAAPPNSFKPAIVYGIPWFRLQGGKNAVIIDPQVGDLGYVVCSDRDISVVKATGAISNPGSLRRYHVSDGIYVGGCVQQVTPTQYLVFTSTGVRLADLGGNSVAMSASGIVLNSPNGVKIQIGGTTIMSISASGVSITGTLSSTGNATAGAIDLQTHVHTGVTVGSGSTGPPTG